MNSMIYLGVLASCLTLSCGQDRAMLALKANKVPALTSRIEADVYFQTNEKRSVSPFTEGLLPGTNRFLFSFPEGQTGAVKIELRALTKNNCTVGSALYEKNISGLVTISDETTFNEYQLAEGTTSGLLSVWGISQNDVWAVGLDGKILHWDGLCWIDYSDSKLKLGGFASVHGSSSSDVWAVGSQRLIRHWNGKIWESALMQIDLSIGDAQSVLAFDPKDAWIAGYSGDSFILYRWNGTSWFEMKKPAASAIESKNYNDLQNVPPPTYNDKLFTIAGTSSQNMLLAGTSRNDAMPSPKPGLMYNLGTTQAPNFAYREKVTGSNDIYTNDTKADYQRAWTAAADDYWFGVSGDNNPMEGPAIVHWDGKNMLKQVLGSDPNVVVNAIGGIKTGSNYDMWVSSVDRVKRINRLYRNAGSPKFDIVTDGAFSGKEVTAIWGISANDVWFVGLGGLRVHWDGSKYTTYP